MALAAEPGCPPALGASAHDVLRSAADRLADAGCASPRLDAELLLADALGTGREVLYLDPDRPLERPAAERLARQLDRRARREPVAYILGRRAFRRLELSVDRRALIPRPETELLVEVTLGALARGGRVHEVGTGSGAVALALKDERPDLRVSASDASEAALAVASANAARLALDVGLELAPDLPPAAGAPDLVVANLPYVRDDEWPTLSPEVTDYEPPEALLGGGRDGLATIRRFVAGLPPDTRVALEHAPAQAAAIRTMLVGPESCRGPGGDEDVTLGRAP